MARSPDAAIRAIASALATSLRPDAGYAGQQAATATIVAELRALGLDAGTARVIADRSNAIPVPGATPITPAMRAAHGQAAASRAAYLVGAGRRLAGKTGLDRLDQQTREARFLRQHVNAQGQREQGAMRIDAAAQAYGPLLGWHAVLDGRTTPECREAHGKNFRPAAPPAIGLPGVTHVGCRCTATTPYDDGPVLDAAGGTDQGHGMAIAMSRARTRGAIQLADSGPKDGPGGTKVYGNGLTYDPKTNSFHPTTDGEKDFNAKHPRAGKGSPEGGQFVKAGQARDANAAKAQADPKAKGNYERIGKITDPKAQAAEIHKLSEGDLEALSRYAYSFKSSDPRLVALRTRIAGELRTRGQDVNRVGGGLAGKVAAKSARAASSGTRRSSTPTLSKGMTRRKDGAILLGEDVDPAKVHALQVQGWWPKRSDNAEAIYPPGTPGTVRPVNLARIELAEGKPGQRYRHGWIPITPGTSDLGKQHATKITMKADMKSRRAHAESMSDDELKAADAELAHRAALLGKAGQVSGSHKAIKDERAQRKAARAVTAGKIKLSRSTQALIELAQVSGNPFPVSPRDHTIKGETSREVDGDHKGGMIALLPSAAHAKAMAVKGGESPEDMHVTLTYLGDDVRGWAPEQRQRVIDRARQTARHTAPVDARVFAHATFNPDAHAGHDPCAVHLVGDTDRLHSLHRELKGLASAAQHPGYVPHITGGYGKTAADLSYTGPVRFDRMLVALGNHRTEIPLHPPTGPEARDGLAYDLARPFVDGRREAAIELSAMTATYSTKHSPLGKPGGPGLWGHKGLQLPAYIQNVAKGIMTSGTLDKSKAIEIAIGKIRDWSLGKGNVSPEVRAASVKAMAEFRAARAATRSGSRNLARDNRAAAVELAWSALLHPRAPSGGPIGGQFVSAKGALRAAKGRTDATGRAHYVEKINDKAFRTTEVRPRGAHVRIEPGGKHVKVSGSGMEHTVDAKTVQLARQADQIGLGWTEKLHPRIPGGVGGGRFTSGGGVKGIERAARRDEHKILSKTRRHQTTELHEPYNPNVLGAGAFHGNAPANKINATLPAGRGRTERVPTKEAELRKRVSLDAPDPAAFQAALAKHLDDNADALKAGTHIKVEPPKTKGRGSKAGVRIAAAALMLGALGGNVGSATEEGSALGVDSPNDPGVSKEELAEVLGRKGALNKFGEIQAPPGSGFTFV